MMTQSARTIQALETNQSGTKEALSIDRFVIYDDNSAAAHSKNGTFYAMQFFDIGGEIAVPYCACPFVPNAKKDACRHRRKLRSLLLAPARIEKYFRVCETLDDEDTPVIIETECGTCGEFVVDCWAWVRPEGYTFGGLLALTVCGCGVRHDGAFLSVREGENN